MRQRAVAHLKHHIPAYLALLFAIGGGSGAIAATTLSGGGTHGCVNRRTGVLSVARHCTRNQRGIIFGRQGPAGPAGPAGATGPAGPAGPAGAPGTAAFGQVSGSGTFFEPVDARGLTLTHAGTGIWNLAITAKCAQSSSISPTVTPFGKDNAGTPIAYVDDNPAGGQGNNNDRVITGYLNSSGAFVQADQDFDIAVQCY